MNGHAGNARVGPHSARSRNNVRDRVAHRTFAGKIEPDTADFGFVHDVRRQDFCHDARSLRQKRPRRGGGFIGIAGELRGCDRNEIGGKQPCALDVKENRSGPAVQREEVEQVAEIDIDLISQ
jgi:hypothetical protein